ncbi:MAG: AMP-binding protein, partial [Porphyromonas sp.]|nr:AMP-binding protein [Porphyromonas sp.]
MIQQNFVQLYENSFKKYWSLPAITNYNNATTYTYANVAKNVAKVHLLLKEAGVKKGDKISLIGKDSAEWCMVYMGIITYGAVIVPILQDFHANDILHIIEHSDSRVVFVSQS